MTNVLLKVENEKPKGNFVDHLTNSKSLFNRSAMRQANIKHLVSIVLVFGQVQQQQRT